MKISVIMPSYLGDYAGAASNRPEKFVRAVNSFIDQQWPDSELIIVSDGCELTKNALYGMNLAGPIPDHFLLDNMREIRLISLPKQPPFSGAVRNAGIKEARGEIITYLDTDDMLLRGHLGAVFQAFFKYPDRPAEYRCWVYFNDFIAGPDLQPVHERNSHLRYGGIGSGMFAHEKGLDVQWKDEYGHDWLFVQDLMQRYPHTKKVTGTGYLTCHVPPNIDV